MGDRGYHEGRKGECRRWVLRARGQWRELPWFGRWRHESVSKPGLMVDRAACGWGWKGNWAGEVGRAL